MISVRDPRTEGTEESLEPHLKWELRCFISKAEKCIRLLWHENSSRHALPDQTCSVSVEKCVQHRTREWINRNLHQDCLWLFCLSYTQHYRMFWASTEMCALLSATQDWLKYTHPHLPLDAVCSFMNSAGTTWHLPLVSRWLKSAQDVKLLMSPGHNLYSLTRVWPSRPLVAARRHRSVRGRVTPWCHHKTCVTSWYENIQREITDNHVTSSDTWRLRLLLVLGTFAQLPLVETKCPHSSMQIWPLLSSCPCCVETTQCTCCWCSLPILSRLIFASVATPNESPE